MFIKLTELEQQKLKSLAYDEVAMEALKKFFLERFTEPEEVLGTELLASNQLAIYRMREAFAQLDKMRTPPHEESLRKNVV